MVCIYCGTNLDVMNSRPQKGRNQTWRRRHCKACGAVFTSTEAIDLSQAISVSYEASASQSQPDAKNLPHLAAFDRDRLYISLYESLRHRASATTDARGLADTVTARVASAATNGLVERRTIMRTALNTLQRFDHAAATHYAAFHRP